MTKSKALPGLGLVLAIISGGLWIGASVAEDPPIKRTELLRTDLAGVAGKEVVIYIADLRPGAAGGRHTHYGDEFVYILDGAIIVTPDGQAPVTLKAGETAHLTADVTHAAKNASDSATAKVLVFLAVEKGKPLAEPVK